MKQSHSPLSRLLALLLLATVLFARLAAAGYVCPPEWGAMAEPVSMAATASCPQMDEAQPALCADHQQDGRHWADSNTHAPDLGILPTLTGPLHLLPPTPYTAPASLTAHRRTTSPGPVYLATARLRI